MAHRRFIADRQVLACKRQREQPDRMLVKLRAMTAGAVPEWVSMSEAEYRAAICYGPKDMLQAKGSEYTRG